MDLNRSIFLVWLFYFLSLTYNSNGVEGGSPLTKEEDIELEKQLKLLNKPAIKTIKTEDGDIYDCVDFFKQPAFDHPLLKNHTFHFQMRPSSMPKVMRGKEHSTTNANTVKAELKGLDCPFGTVPIRRVTKDDLVRAKLHSDSYSLKNDSKFRVLTLDNPGAHYALVRTKLDMTIKYNGGSASISIYNPPVGPTQSSSARLRIQNGADSIQVGWTVNPTLYGSNGVRLYTHLKTSKSECFNTQCPGFVIVNTEIPLDVPLRPAERGVLPTYVVDVMIYRDKLNGNWWLTVHDRQLGFWPKSIFTGLADLAYEVGWGGEVSSPPYIPSPPMGSSYFPERDTTFDAYCEKMKTINEDDEKVDATTLTEEFSDVDAYQIKDVGLRRYPFSRLMYFGGPGGATGS